jgi:hypothetical protein
MTNTYIQKYLSEYGYDVNLPTIGHGVKKVEKNMSNDPDYITLIKKLK